MKRKHCQYEFLQISGLLFQTSNHHCDCKSRILSSGVSHSLDQQYIGISFSDKCSISVAVAIARKTILLIPLDVSKKQLSLIFEIRRLELHITSVKQSYVFLWNHLTRCVMERNQNHVEVRSQTRVFLQKSIEIV